MNRLFILAFVFAANLTFGADRANIILLLADDLGWTGLGCFGSDFYETPNLDRMAEEGMKFTNAYSACTVCSPTRASIMTGQYPARLHLTDFIPGQNRPFAKLSIPDWQKGLLHEHTTVAEALRDSGYSTGMIGKWHLERKKADKEDAPTQHGFDVQYMTPPGTKGYYLSKKIEEENGKTYLTDYLTDQAIGFIEESAEKPDPFFLYMAYHVPHTPIQGREDLVKAFSEKARPEAIHHNPVYAAMVASMDQSVGRILESLHATGEDQNTLIIFTSDNGGLTTRNGKHDDFTENLPLRRGKGSAYEGGVRVPAIVKWPGVVKPETVCDTPIMTIDYFPTFLSVAGVDLSTVVDGKNLTPLFKDSRATLERDLFWHYPHYHAGGDSPYGAIRSGNWRLIEFYEDQKLELYDLSKDIGEQNDLAGKNPDLRDELQGKLHAWRSLVDAQMPTENPNYDPARDSQVKK